MTVAREGGVVGSLFFETTRTQRVDLVFKALADSTRRQILCLLYESRQSVSDIVDHFHLTQPSISRHLAILKSAGLVAYDRQGQKMIYRLGESEPVELAMTFLAPLGRRKVAQPRAAGAASRV